METRSQFQQRRHPTVDGDPSAGGLVDPGHHAKQGRLPASVVADQPMDRTGWHGERDLTHRPEVLVLRSPELGEELLHAPGPIGVKPELFGDVVDVDRSHRLTTPGRCRVTYD